MIFTSETNRSDNSLPSSKMFSLLCNMKKNVSVYGNVCLGNFFLIIETQMCFQYYF